MPPDRSQRSVPSAGSPFTQPSSRNNGTAGPRQVAAENRLASPAGYAPPQPSGSTIVSTSDVSGDEGSNQPPPWVLEHSDSNPDYNYVPYSPYPIVAQSPPFPSSTSQHHERHVPVHQSLQPERNNLILPQTAQPCINSFIAHQHASSYPTQSVHQHDLVNPPHHGLYNRDNPTLQLPQVRQFSHLETAFEQQWSTFQPPHSHQPPTQYPSYLQHRGPDPFYQAHDFVVNRPTFVNNTTLIDNDSNNFMASFLNETIKGAEFDSSDRHMPLRCHPGTRSKIIKRCQDFVLNRDGCAKIRWVVGSAGVGKSAIMQSVAYDSNVLSEVIVGATVFFSINGRQDGTKAIPTIAFQLATRLKPYRLFVQREFARDPTLCRKTLSRQFHKFIVEPFIHQRIAIGSSRLLIIIDGLDECANPLTQQELLGLISFFCIKYPTSPIMWMIASRPEQHITSFFAQPRVAFAYEKEEILVDAEEAVDDVKRYLRDQFREVKKASIALQELSQWPSDGDFLKIANASGGLFAYASTVVRYISDPDYGDPVPLLNDVLEIIETGSKKNIWGRNHPMAQLDALYSHIMSKIPVNVMANTRKLLLSFVPFWSGWPFQLHCNILGMSQNAVYDATHHIRSIVRVPGPANAGKDRLQIFHKSFPDYLRDFERSGFSPDLVFESGQLIGQCALRILEQSPNGLYMDHEPDDGLPSDRGALENDSKTHGTIAIAWPATEEPKNNRMQLKMFQIAVDEVIVRIAEGEEAVQNLLCLSVLTTCFTTLVSDFPFDQLQNYTFDESRRQELLEHGILKEIPLATFDYDTITIDLHLGLRFRGPTVEGSNPWNLPCKHTRKGKWDGHNQDWLTTFRHPDAGNHGYKCRYCFERFTRHFNTLRSMTHPVTVLALTPTLRWVEFRFVDLDDGVSDWTYYFFTGDVGEDFDLDDYMYCMGSIDEDSSEED